MIKGENVIIKDSCHLGENITIEDNVYIDYNCIIRDGVTIKAGTTIGANCILGEFAADWYGSRSRKNQATVIGENSIIRSGSIIYSGVVTGACFQTGHQVTIREKSIFGNHCSIGTLSDIQGYCLHGDYVRCHSNVFIAQKSIVEDFVWIYPHAVLTNDPTPPLKMKWAYIFISLL